MTLFRAQPSGRRFWLQTAALLFSLLLHGTLLFVLGLALPDSRGSSASTPSIVVSLTGSPAAPASHPDMPPSSFPLRVPIEKSTRTITAAETETSDPILASTVADGEIQPNLSAVVLEAGNVPPIQSATKTGEVFAGGGMPEQASSSSGSGKPGIADREGSGFFPPRPHRTPQPIYPYEARRNGWEGTVLLRVRISVSGAVDDVRVEHSSGHQCLDRAATRAVNTWSFAPARRGVQSVSAEIRVPILFQLAKL